MILELSVLYWILSRKFHSHLFRYTGLTLIDDEITLLQINVLRRELESKQLGYAEKNWYRREKRK